MLTKEKIASLEKYMADLTNRLSSTPNEKQLKRVKEFHQWLRFEITSVKAKLDAAKIANV